MIRNRNDWTAYSMACSECGWVILQKEGTQAELAAGGLGSVGGGLGVVPVQP